MDKVVIENPVEKKRFRWWIWAIIGIVVVLLIIALIFVVSAIKTNSYLKEKEIEEMKAWKCISNCPFVSLPDSNMTFPQTECYAACLTHVKSGDRAKIEKKITAFEQDFVVPCFSLMRQQGEFPFKSCMQEKLKKYSDIVDLSNVDVNVPYPKIDMNIIEANCSSDKAIIRVKLNEGKDIQKIEFLFTNELGSAKVVMKTEIPDIGEIREYPIKYSEENVTFKPNKIELAAVYMGKIISEDKKVC